LLFFQLEGQTALHVAAMEGDESIVKLLFAAKSDANIADEVGFCTCYISTHSLYLCSVFFTYIFSVLFYSTIALLFT
jgi:hypothetical protein